MEKCEMAPQDEQVNDLKMRLCMGCGGQILDQFILQVAPNLEWHAACLRCCECNMLLDETHTCFVREGRIFCKQDYLRLFSTRCGSCLASFVPNEYVMRAKGGRVFHPSCFRCHTCRRLLVPGDEFSMRESRIYCKDDAMAIEDEDEEMEQEENNNNNNNNEDEDDDSAVKGGGGSSISDGDDDDSYLHPRPDSVGSSCLASESGGTTGLASVGRKDKSGQPGFRQQVRRNRAGRVRTVLSEKQLSLLKSCYSANPRPDALMKEQLVEMTGLSPRVVRVWFQNKRCKDKKKLAMKQGKDGRKLSYSAMSGIPMVASAPIRGLPPPPPPPPHYGGPHLMHQQDPSQGYDVRCYEPPWKALCDFALNTDIDKIGGGEDGNRQFRHIVNQIHGCYPPEDGSVPPPPIPPPVPDGSKAMPPEGPEEDAYTLTSLDG